MQIEAKWKSVSRFRAWLLPLLGVSLIFTLASSRQQVEEGETSVMTLRQQYPEIFAFVDSVDCGKPLEPTFREFQKGKGTEAITANTGGGSVLKQGPVSALVGRYYVQMLHPPKVRENRCPLLVLPQDYVGGRIFLDEVPVATVKADLTPLLISDEVDKIRIAHEGLPAIEEWVFERGRNYLAVGALETVNVLVHLPDGYRLNQLTVDGEPVNATTGLLKLEPGTHLLRLSSMGEADLFAEVDLDGMRPYVQVYPNRFRPLGPQP